MLVRITSLTALLAAGLMGHASLAQAAGTSPEARYQADVKYCHEQTTQDVKDCLREAGAALYEARQRLLVTGQPDYDTNRNVRCDGLSGVAREDCLRLMSEPGAQVSGSVDGGGILRRMTITIPGEIPGTGS